MRMKKNQSEKKIIKPLPKHANEKNQSEKKIIKPLPKHANEGIIIKTYFQILLKHLKDHRIIFQWIYTECP